MHRRRVLLTLLVLAVLVLLLHWQVRTWRKFDWHTFREQTEAVDWRYILGALALIYADYFLRAVRWKIFLRPVRPQATVARLTRPQFIGFAGLALLGRPGEFIRPYLIARQEKLSFSSQLAVWMVERIFDFGSVGLLVAVNFIFFRESLRGLDPGIYLWFRLAGFGLAGVVLVMIAIALLVRYRGRATAGWIELRLARIMPRLAARASQRILAFREGLNTLHGFSSFLQVMALSLAIWVFVAFAYRLVAHSYPDDTLQSMEIPDVVVLMTASMAGSLIQLPAIGGGSQLATIAVLQNFYDVEPELAVSCGILLWLVTFMAVAPAGLILARSEHLSLRKLEEESQVEH